MHIGSQSDNPGTAIIMDLQKLDEASIALLECMRAQSNSSLNGTANMTVEVTNLTTCGDATVSPKLQPPRHKGEDKLIHLYQIIKIYFMV